MVCFYLMIQSSSFDRTVKEFNHLFIKVTHDLEEEKEVGNWFLVRLQR